MDKNKKLADLLNNESFLRWLKNNAEEQEKKKWHQWESDNEENKKLVKKAKKIVTMPFKSPDQFPDPNEEIEKFKKSLSQQTEEKQSV